MGLCKNCGETVEPGTKFCENCGAAVDGKPVTPPPQPSTRLDPQVVPPAPPKKMPIPSMYIAAGIVVVVIIIALVFVSGLMATSTPKTTPDPIIGSWIDDTTEWVIYSNGTAIWWTPDFIGDTNNILAGKIVVHQLTWTKTGTGRYLLSAGSEGSKVFLIDATRDVLYREDLPDFVLQRSNTVLTPPNPGQITPTVTVTPTVTITIPKTTTALSKDPIIGAWSYSDKVTGYGSEQVYIYHFYGNGTFTKTASSDSTFGSKYVRDGTWSAKGSNSYQFNYQGQGNPGTMVYDPERNAIYEYPYGDVKYYPYQG